VITVAVINSLSTPWPSLTWFVAIIFCGHYCCSRHCFWPSLYTLDEYGTSSHGLSWSKGSKGTMLLFVCQHCVGV